MITVGIPEPFAQHTIESFREEGPAWLAALPRLVAELAERWELVEVGEPFELSYNFVLPTRRADGTEAVLKLSCPDTDTSREMLALRAYDGEGACRLLAADDARYAMLLERLRPGATLVGVAERDDEAATRIGARLMRSLWRLPPAEAPFRPIREWFDAAFARHRAEYGGAGPFPPALFARAEVLAYELLDSATEDLLLHGDFHHYNVLSAERAPWLAIDPKGMRGDPGYEVGPFLLNPNQPEIDHTPALLARRLDVLAEELGSDRARLRDWGVAHGVLSAMWSAEDGGDGWEDAIAAAETLLRL